MKCEVCHQGPPTGPAIFRINKPGDMPARWRCWNCMTLEQRGAVDSEVKEITSIFEGRQPITPFNHR